MVPATEGNVKQDVTGMWILERPRKAPQPVVMIARPRHDGKTWRMRVATLASVARPDAPYNVVAYVDGTLANYRSECERFDAVVMVSLENDCRVVVEV